MMSRSVLVTGANGFVGHHLCRYLNHHHIDFCAAVRSGRDPIAQAKETVWIDAINDTTLWDRALQNIDCVVHLAALSDSPKISVQSHKEVNYDGTLRLAQEASRYGVKKFIFLSTVKVNGEVSNECPFRADDIPKPVSEYAKSKLAAEKALLELDQNTNLSVMIVRPPIVYGAGGGGNIALLANAIKRKIPLPFDSIDNHRSMLSITNLCSFIYRLIESDISDTKIALISDDEDVSTPQLVRKIARVLNREPYLFKCPPKILKTALKIAHKGDWYAKLCCNLQVNIAQHQKQFQWRPQVSMDQALAEYLQ